MINIVSLSRNISNAASEHINLRQKVIIYKINKRKSVIKCSETT